MENILNLSVILPIKSSITRDFDEYFDRAILSLKNQKVKFSELVIVHTLEETLVNKLQNYDFGDLTVKLVEFSGDANFQSQINLGV